VHPGSAAPPAPTHLYPDNDIQVYSEDLRLLVDEIAGLFLPWSVANAAAIEAGDETFSVDLADGPFSQTPQKYHARSLAEIRRKYAAAANPDLDAILEETGCLGYL
jgi:hypothetical protein